MPSLGWCPSLGWSSDPSYQDMLLYTGTDTRTECAGIGLAPSSAHLEHRMEHRPSERQSLDRGPVLAPWRSSLRKPVRGKDRGTMALSLASWLCVNTCVNRRCEPTGPARCTLDAAMEPCRTKPPAPRAHSCVVCCKGVETDGRWPRLPPRWHRQMLADVTA